jgi:hypothetical protein
MRWAADFSRWHGAPKSTNLLSKRRCSTTRGQRGLETRRIEAHPVLRLEHEPK